MKKNKFLVFASFLLIAIIFSSCATIVGGSKYRAHIFVKDHPNAEIVYNGLGMGYGAVSITVPRKNANKFFFTVREKGCAEQIYSYQRRSFRVAALIGTLVTYTASSGGVLFPYGAIVDLITGAFWKPNTGEGIIKYDYKSFRYEVNYTKCNEQEQNQNSSVIKSDKLVDVVYLKNGSIIRGSIIESEPDSHIKIQTKDGSMFVYKVDEILKITRE